MFDILAMPGAAGLLHPGGGIVLTRVVQGEGEILTLAVAPQARRRGIGRALLGGVVADGIPWFLEVAASNGPALALYAAFGFCECGRRRDYYAPGRDALVLRRPPNPCG
jgi:ribosomal-protein-alanine N-acetyltransferase